MPTTTSVRPLKYAQLAQHFREQMKSGALRPGDQLPTLAHMQAEFGIGQGTMERVYGLLEKERLIERRPKRGTFVIEYRPQAVLEVVGIALADDETHIPQHHPYYLRLLDGMREVARRENIEMMLLHDRSYAKRERIDGIITIFNNMPQPDDMPRVDVLGPMPNVPSVVSDDYGGTKAAMEHLIGLGHTKIAFLTMPTLDTPQQILLDRKNAYTEALIAAGIEPSRRWVRLIRQPWQVLQEFSDLGYGLMQKWLSEDWHKLGCTAILAHNDDTAIGVLRALREGGINVPRDVSVVGFDGSTVSEYVHPRLTTVIVPLRDIGMSAMELLLSQIRAPMDTERILLQVLPTRLEVRESTARCAVD